MPVVAIIPARYASTRLPGKPLSDIQGKPLIQHVYERALGARSVTRVLVATDDERIATTVRAFGGQCVMTSALHQSGTDRLAEAAQTSDESIVVNVQGDEPLLDPEALDAAVAALQQDATVPIATLSAPLRDVDEFLASQVVKVVTDARGDALYFSRSPIPYLRDPGPDRHTALAAAVTEGLARKHIGLYVYRREALLRFASLPPAPLELAEGLEQLRALHHGMRIRVVRWHEAGVAVDTPQDLEHVRALFAARAVHEPPQRRTLDQGRNACPPSTSS